jgi:lipoyl(octanoyl) transferase
MTGAALFDRLSWWDDLTPHSAGLNMAIDQILLEKIDTPLLRHYRWDRPCVSFGYFGRWAEVQAQTAPRPLMRRWTGGGVVWHGADATYSLIVPASAALAEKTAAEVTCALHRSLAACLREKENIPAHLSDETIPSSATHPCFTQPVRADLIHGEQKIAGVAQRRTQHGLLCQGSIQNIFLPDDFFAHWATKLAMEKADHFFDFPARWLEEAQHLARERYDQAEWLQKR